MTKASTFSHLPQYFKTLERLLGEVVTTDSDGSTVPCEQACEWVRDAAHEAHDRGQKVMFVGNGGSAAIASHLAIDYSKNGRLRSVAFNDAAALTCLGNDYGYGEVFSAQLQLHGRPGDLLIAISSSGRSPNILGAARAARQIGSRIATLSGFTEDNDLRGMGDMNFFVPSGEYGFVEVAHLALCHAILDIDMGWSASDRSTV